MPPETPIDTIPQEADAPTNLLSLQEIADALNEHYHRVRPFAGIAGIGEHLGAVNVKGLKGVRYQPLAVEKFRQLIAAKDAKVITLTTALAYLSNIEGSPVSAAGLPQSVNLDSNVGLPQSGAALAGAITGLVERIDRVLTAPADDRLVGREEAAALLACRPARVSAYVKPVRRSVWRHSDILKYIASL